MQRTNLVCHVCRDSTCPLDERLGLTEYLSPQAKRLCCLAGASWSFDAAAKHLFSFCGLTVSDECIRQVTQQLAPKLEQFATTEPAAVDPFQAAQGDLEWETDAVKVNTVTGWRDAKIGIFAKRPRGQMATAAEWASRNLPKPTARFACAQIAESTAFAERWAPTAQRLGIEPTSAELTVLGDGAEWIWNRSGEVFPNATEVLDVFHATQKIAAAANAWCSNPELATRQYDRGRELLLSDGYAGITDWVGELSGQPFVGGDGAAMGEMLNYLAGHQDRLNYALRLRRGQSIGSGMVEGAAKNMIGKRLKANNARWCEENVNRMGTLCAALYSEYWDAFWENN